MIAAFLHCEYHVTILNVVPFVVCLICLFVLLCDCAVVPPLLVNEHVHALAVRLVRGTKGYSSTV